MLQLEIPLRMQKPLRKKQLTITIQLAANIFVYPTILNFEYNHCRIREISNVIKFIYKRICV